MRADAMILAATTFSPSDDHCAACLDTAAGRLLVILGAGRGRHVRALRRAVRRARPDQHAVNQILGAEEAGKLSLDVNQSSSAWIA